MLKNQLTPLQVKDLEKQQYRIVGSHSAVKVCGWTKEMIRGNSGCYKFVFYGIRSHQCLQMTTSMFCANRCTFCWRGAKAPVSKQWYGPVDAPVHIIEHAIKAHQDLLQGFKGNKDANKKALNDSGHVRHVALSLTGEPISYPKINEILEEFHKRKISTFLVTNAQYPEQIKKLKCLTQLYISLDAPNKELLKKIDKPLFTDYYKRLERSLDFMREKEFRTCIRITVIKGLNDTDEKGYEELINRAKPDFIEIKSYMHIGHGKKNHSFEQMLTHEETVRYSKRLANTLVGYDLISESPPSRVCLLIRKDRLKYRYIDFSKFFELANNKGYTKTEEYGSDKLEKNY